MWKLVLILLYTLIYWGIGGLIKGI